MSDLMREADLLIECMDDEIAERTRKKLRGSVAVLRTFRNMAAAIRDKLALAAVAPPPEPECICKPGDWRDGYYDRECPRHGDAAPVPPAAPQPATDAEDAEPVAWIDRDDLAALQVQQDNHDSDQLFYPPVSRWKTAPGDVPLYLAPHSAGPATGSVAPTLSGSGESSSPSVGSSVAERTAKNAARYEWLREWHLGMYLPDGYVHGPGEPGADADQQAVLDTAIDAAMGSATEPRPLGTGR